MTKTELKKIMLECIAEADNDRSLDDWYCTDRDVVENGISVLAKKLNIDLYETKEK